MTYELRVTNLLPCAHLISAISHSYAKCDSLPCLQGRAGVGLFELAAWFECVVRLLHPTPTLPPDQVRGRLYYT
jgi:hypothetical protein